MDQVKVILGGIKKYHFWILCTVVIIAGLTSWYLSTSNLRAETTKNASTIKTKVTEVEAVGKISPHPNNDFLTGMDKIIDEYSVYLGKGWQYRYDQQKDLLLWPKFLGNDFIQRVNGLRPIEEYVTYEEKGYVPSQEIDSRYLETYRNFITLELPELAKKIGAKWTAKAGESSGSSLSSGGRSSMSASSKMSAGGSGGRGGLRGGDGGEEEVDRSIVRWNPANQQEILDGHFRFVSEQATPHTLDVLYAQEDLWVLDAIMNVIKRTNGDADANYNAAVKEIESIEMGRTVRGRLGQITMLNQAGGMQGGSSGSMSAPSGSMSAPGGSMSPPAPGGSMAAPGGGSSSAGPAPGGSSSSSSMGPAPGGGGSMGSSSMSSVAGPVDPALGRYVDIDYNPLDPKDLRAARTSQDPKQAIYAVAKRMPVRLRLKIDQRKLNDLLAECGNSSLPIEVRQVRINCEAAPGGDSRGSGGSSVAPSSSSSSGGGGMSMGPAPGPGSSSSSSYGSKSLGKSRMGLGGGSSSGGEPIPDSNEIVVDVYGIVHIYNPVNQQQLTTSSGAAASAEGAAPAAPAAPTAPVSPAPPTSPTAAAAVETGTRS
jgi:hypothetical protein